MGERYGFLYETASDAGKIVHVLELDTSESPGTGLHFKLVPIQPVEPGPERGTPADDLTPRSSETPVQAPRTHNNFRRSITGLILIVAVIAACFYAHRWWTVSRFLQNTNDSYLRADQIAIAPRIAGYIREVLVAENQLVQIGQPLVRIDPEVYLAVRARQRAILDARLADITVAEAQFQQQLATVEEAAAKLDGSRLGARFAAREAERYRLLGLAHAESAERLAQKASNSDQAIAAQRSTTAALSAARRQTETAQAEIGRARANVQAARAAVQEADLDVDDTLLRARTGGRVGDLTTRVGQYVQPGTRLLTIVPIETIYVIANFKETQIGRLRVGQPANISVDAFAGEVLHGVVDSFAPGTGAQFALLPPENATGNFTKIVQRVPVRLRIETDGETRTRLLPGLSVTVEIDTRNLGISAEDKR